MLPNNHIRVSPCSVLNEVSSVTASRMPAAWQYPSNGARNRCPLRVICPPMQSTSG